MLGWSPMSQWGCPSGRPDNKQDEIRFPQARSPACRARSCRLHNRVTPPARAPRARAKWSATTLYLDQGPNKIIAAVKRGHQTLDSIH